MASQSRTDSLVFFLISLAFFLFIRRSYFICSFLLMLAVETHYIGVMGFFYCLAYAIAYPSKALGDSGRERMRAFILLTVGLVAGILMYLILHMDALMHNFISTIQNSTGGGIIDSNYILAYFFRTKYYRHIPELLVFAVAATIFIKQKMIKEQNNKMIAVLTILVVISSVIVRRGSFLYMPFAFVSFLCMTVAVAEHYKKIWLLNLLWLALLIPQYGYVYYKQRHYPGTSAYVEMIRHEVPQDELPVFGDNRIWFAYIGKSDVHNVRRLGQWFDDLDKYNYNAFYLTGYDQDLHVPMETAVESLSTKYNCEIISKTEFYNKPVPTWKCTIWQPSSVSILLKQTCKNRSPSVKL